MFNHILKSSSLISSTKNSANILRTFRYSKNLNTTFFKKPLLLTNKNVMRQNNKRTNTNDTKSNEKMEHLNRLLSENKTKNIKVYSCASTGSITVNLMGMVGSFVILAFSYQAWLMFRSENFTNRDISRETGFYGAALKVIGSYYFQIGTCVTLAILGI